MQLKDFILRLNTYRRVNHDLPIDRLIYYDLNHDEREIFSYNFYLRPSAWNDSLFSFDNHHNLLLTKAAYNNDLYVIINVKDDYYAYYRLSHHYDYLTFVIFKIYPPGVHYVFDAGRKASFRCDWNEYFSAALQIVRRPCFDLLNPEYNKTLSFKDSYINENLFLAITKLNNLIKPYKLLYVIR